MTSYKQRVNKKKKGKNTMNVQYKLIKYTYSYKLPRNKLQYNLNELKFGEMNISMFNLFIVFIILRSIACVISYCYVKIKSVFRSGVVRWRNHLETQDSQ